MERREFIAGAAAVLGARVPPATSHQPPAAHDIRPIGVQLYTLRDEMRRDVEATLARVARIGYTEVEFAGYFDRTPAQLRAALRRNRLRAVSSHVEAGDINLNWREKLDFAAALGIEYIVVAWTPQEMRRTLDAWRRIGDLYNRGATEARAAGLKFAYHNHSYEFEPMEGQLPYDVLLAATDPALVKLEMDMYWITRGGQDPLAYFDRYPGRTELVHVKDLTREGQMANVGEGAIDFRRIFAQRRKAGIKHYFVEHDEPADPWDSITKSYRYLHRLDVPA